MTRGAVAAAVTDSVAPSPAASLFELPFLGPVSGWPQFVITNRAEFRGHTALVGASSFLVTNAHGAVVLATARHLIREAGGVEPPLVADELDAALVSWVVNPRTQPERTVRIGGVALPGLDAGGRDWLVLQLLDSSQVLPSRPLRLRRPPVSNGETVYLLGAPYSEPDARQNVYKGKVTKRYDGDYFRYDIDPPVEIRGFSGAPIVDSNGLVVGVMTIRFEPRSEGDKQLEAGGEDVGWIFDAVESLEPPSPTR